MDHTDSNDIGSTGADSDVTDGQDVGAMRKPELDRYLRFARAHADTSDTRQWVSDLEDMLRVAWDLMTPEQRAAFCDHPDILAIEDTVSGGTAAA